MARLTEPHRWFDNTPVAILLVMLMFGEHRLSLRNLEVGLVQHGMGSSTKRFACRGTGSV